MPGTSASGYRVLPDNKVLSRTSLFGAVGYRSYNPAGGAVQTYVTQTAGGYSFLASAGPANDGRIAGHRFAPEHNWVDDGALSLGIASYALVDGDESLVYDTHISVPHARAVRTALEGRGVGRFTVVLSHWHLDHIAGTAAFADCEVIANRRTAAHMSRCKEAI